jgi:hypothetical protein
MARPHRVAASPRSVCPMLGEQHRQHLILALRGAASAALPAEESAVQYDVTPHKRALAGYRLSGRIAMLLNAFRCNLEVSDG